MLFESGHQVRLWEFDEHAALRLAEERQEPDKLPGIFLPPDILVTNDLKKVLDGGEIHQHCWLAPAAASTVYWAYKASRVC